MGMARFNFKESYIYTYGKSINKSVAISGAVSFVLSIFAAFNLCFSWIRDNTMNVILLVIPLVTFAIIALVYIPYDIWKNQKAKISDLENAVKRTNKLSERARADIAHIRNIKVLEIPSTLRKINQQMLEIAQIQIRQGLDKEMLRRVLIDLLETYDVDTTDLYTVPNNLESIDDHRLKKQLNRLMRGTTKAFSIKPTDKASKTKLVTYFTYLEGVLRKRNMSIEQYCEHNVQYKSLTKKLEVERERVTDKLSLAIDDALLYINGFGNTMLVSLYTQTDYSDLKVFRTLRWKKYNIALFSYYRLFNTLINELIGRVAKYADEYVVGID